MKILRVGTFPTIDKPGVGLHAAELCNISTFKTFYLTSKEVADREVVKGDFELLEFGVPLEKRILKSNLYLNFSFVLRRIYNLAKFSLYGTWLIFSKKIDIVHIHSPLYMPIAFVCFILRKRVYITFHGTDFYRVKDSILYRLFGKMFTKVFAISPDMLKTLSKIHGSDNVILVGNGINLDIFKNHHVNRKKQIIAVGELKTEKGFEYLIEAFSNLKKNNSIQGYNLLIESHSSIKGQSFSPLAVLPEDQ